MPCSRQSRLAIPSLIAGIDLKTSLARNNGLLLNNVILNILKILFSTVPTIPKSLNLIIGLYPLNLTMQTFDDWVFRLCLHPGIGESTSVLPLESEHLFQILKSKSENVSRALYYI